MAEPGAIVRRRGGRIGNLLLACLSGGATVDVGQISALAATLEPAEITEAARYHRVVVPVHEVLRTAPGVDAAVLDALAALRREAVAASFRVVRALHQVRNALDPAGLRWLVVKGPVLSDLLYSQRGTRTYHDLDVLVQPADFRAALEALERAGFALVDPNWDFHRGWVAAELRLRFEGGADVDLHWHLIFARELRRFFRLPIPDIVARAREVDVHGLAVRTLDPADTLLHLAVHACREGGDRLFWLKDIEQAVVNDRPDWGDVVARAREWRVAILVGTMLLRTRATLGAPVPDDVVAALLPRTWRAAAATADRFFPPERSRARGTVASLLAHSARDSFGSSSSTVAANVVRLIGLFVHGEPWRREEWDRGRGALENPADPTSKAHPLGGGADREWLLEEVLREGGAPAAEDRAR